MLQPTFPGDSDDLAREAAAFLVEEAKYGSLEGAPLAPPKHLLLPYSDSKPAQRALEAVVELSSVFTAGVRVLHFRTWEPGRGGPIFFETRNDALDLTRVAVSRLRTFGVSATGTVHDAARLRLPHEIVAKADELRSCAIILGAHQRRVIPAALIGSVSRNVILHANCPVMVIRYANRLGAQ